MKFNFLGTCIILFNIALVATAQSPQSSAILTSTQIVVVTTHDWNAVNGVLLRYERAQANKGWKLASAPITIVVGKNGMGWGSGVLPIGTFLTGNSLDPVKKEGDGRSPAGIFRLSTSFGYATQPKPGWKMPYINLTSSVECVDDSASRFYNRVLDRTTVSPDWHSSEKMLQAGEAYRFGIVVDHNTNPAVPAGGSCIFMHIWSGRGQGTVGCTAMPEEQLKTVLAWLDPVRNPLLVQFPYAQYEKERKHWHLPKLPRSSQL